MESNDLNHDIRNSLSAMGLATKHMARLISILYKEYERLKEIQKKYDKCKKCMKVKIE